MIHLSIQSMKTLHYIPKLDGKLLAYGIAWLAVIAAATIGVVAFA